MRLAVCVVAVALVGCAPPAAPPLAGPSSAPEMVLPARAARMTLPQTDQEWDAVGDEAVRLLSQYLRINTTNPPGNELTAAQWLRAVLAREGIGARIYEPRAGKANLVARLRGDGRARPLVLLNHMDVVLATPEYWKVPPFSGEIRDGYVWGRGALDMKGEGIAQLMTLLLLRRSGLPLARDIVFVATADEEVNGGVGASWMATDQADVFRDAEFLLTEGGTIRAGPDGRPEYFGVGTTEKSPYWLDMTARGTPGHGSRPTADNPVHRLVRALGRIAAWETPLTVTPTVERYFRELAGAERDTVRRRWYRDIRAALDDPAAVRALTADPVLNAVLRNTISITGLKGSDKTNVIPPVATAVLDVRLLPGQDPQAFLADLTRVVDDTLVTFRRQGLTWAATESGADTDLFGAIAAAARARAPDAVVTPYMLAGFTDSHYFRRMGIAAYGISPFPITAEESRGVHGNDERLSVAALRFGVRYYFEIVRRVAAQ
jgi:acetylornithine deacetylase/succinyl-diaminopimelate desuccinylase-like protein